MSSKSFKLNLLLMFLVSLLVSEFGFSTERDPRDSRDEEETSRVSANAGSALRGGANIVYQGFSAIGSGAEGLYNVFFKNLNASEMKKCIQDYEGVQRAYKSVDDLFCYFRQQGRKTDYDRLQERLNRKLGHVRNCSVMEKKLKDVVNGFMYAPNPDDRYQLDPDFTTSCELK